MSHIFISYSRRDGKVVAQFVESLRKQDFIVWQDVNNISAGAAWHQALMDAIEQSAAVVVFWTQAASLSKAVSEEIDHALKNGKQVIPVWLEQATPLRLGLQEAQAVISSQCSPNAVHKIVTALLEIAPRIQRQVTDFNANLPMNAQTIADITREVIGNREYVIAPLVTSAYSRAHVLAEAGTIVRQATRIQLMVQCTRGVGYTMPRDVFQVIMDEDAEYGEAAQPLVGLYVSGPLNPLDHSQYQIDSTNVAHYSDIIDTTRKAINHLVKDTAAMPTFQVFQQVLVEIAFLLGVQADRWLPFQLYKWEGGRYIPIMSIPPRVPN